MAIVLIVLIVLIAACREGFFLRRCRSSPSVVCPRSCSRPAIYGVLFRGCPRGCIIRSSRSRCRSRSRSRSRPCSSTVGLLLRGSRGWCRPVIGRQGRGGGRAGRPCRRRALGRVPSADRERVQGGAGAGQRRRGGGGGRDRERARGVEDGAGGRPGEGSVCGEASAAAGAGAGRERGDP